LFESIKYLHIMTHGNSTHNGTIINMINDESLPFSPTDHIFFIIKKNCYENFKHYKNVFLKENIISSNMKEFNNYAKNSQYVFLHCNNLSYFQILKLNKEVIKKIIWCVWGEEYLYPNNDKPKGFHRKLRRCGRSIVRYLVDRRIKNFYAIGIGFKFDSIAVRKRFGDIRILALPYGYRKGKKDSYEHISESDTKNVSQGSYKIMIGHSAYEYLQHKKILKALYKFRDENILISLILSYGNMEYAKTVEDYALKMFPGKVEIIKKYMSPDEYFRYLKTVDIGIFDYTQQAALGNIWMLLYLGKKLYLNEKGILKLATRLEAVETYNVNEIENMNYEEFTKAPNNKHNSKSTGEFYMDENNYLSMWLNTLRELR
jgi:dTDP-N-acetylfucosamine:lipid II N-acetylfucosaminyltransferase